MFFVIGDIKGGRVLKANLSMLFALSAARHPKVLYAGAACDNRRDYRNAFEQGLAAIHPAIEMQSLNLSEHTPLTDRQARPETVERKFADADVVFFDGGGIAPLAKTYERFQLADLVKNAVARGAHAGGLCAGGSFMAERVVFYENQRVGTMRGVGLVARTAVSCHMSIADQFQRRAALLRRILAKGKVDRAIGLGDNQAVVFRNGAPFQLSSGISAGDRPFLVDARGGTAPLPAFPSSI